MADVIGTFKIKGETSAAPAVTANSILNGQRVIERLSDGSFAFTAANGARYIVSAVSDPLAMRLISECLQVQSAARI